jgi:RimJ/RimL family protein N-acetyltransferase
VLDGEDDDGEPRFFLLKRLVFIWSGLRKGELIVAIYVDCSRLLTPTAPGFSIWEEIPFHGKKARARSKIACAVRLVFVWISSNVALDASHAVGQNIQGCLKQISVGSCGPAGAVSEAACHATHNKNQSRGAPTTKEYITAVLASANTAFQARIPVKQEWEESRTDERIAAVETKAIPMRLNYEIAVVGKHCVLVPYRKEHVPTYHEWMQDPRLLESTGSEPLSLSSEYEMQASWRDDDKKCTFIVMDREKVNERSIESAKVTAGGTVVDADLCNPKATALSVARSEFVLETLSAMVGDVNLFFSNWHDDDVENDDDNEKDGRTASTTPFVGNLARPRGSRLQAEIDIMVAVATSRGKGIGREAVVLMMQYARENIPGLRRFFCKINADNVASRTLFEQKLGFRQCDYAECFQQYEYELTYELGGSAATACDVAIGDNATSPLQILHCPISNEEE